MPILAAGTWKCPNDEATSIVKAAVNAGFVHIDTAESYLNQEGVGRGLAGVPREQYFLTSKVPECTVYNNASECTDHYAFTQKMLNFDMARLGVSQIDLMLLHFPPKAGPSGTSVRTGVGPLKLGGIWRVLF